MQTQQELQSLQSAFCVSELRYGSSQGCGSGRAKILPLPLLHRLFDLKSYLAKKFCSFPRVDETVKLYHKPE